MTDPFPKKMHRCWLSSAHGSCGPAIDNCTEAEDGALWVDNGEYSSQVNFCPVCGRKATVQVDAKLFGRDT